MEAAIARSRVDMAHLTLAIDRPARDGIEVVAREPEHRGRLGGLPALCHELLAGRLHVAGFVPCPALQYCGATVPAPRHAEAGKGLGQSRLVERSFRPALSAIG